MLKSSKSFIGVGLATLPASSFTTRNGTTGFAEDAGGFNTLGFRIIEDVQSKNDAWGLMGVCESYQRKHHVQCGTSIRYSRVDREENMGFVANVSEKGLLVYLPEFIETKGRYLEL